MQIRFTPEDLGRVKFMTPGPVLESLLAVRQLRPSAGADPFTAWRRQVAPALERSGAVGYLAELLPRNGRPLDLLMPACGASTRDAGLDQLESLETEYFRREIVHVAKVRSVPRWSESLVERDARPRRALFRALGLVHDVGLAHRVAADTATVRQEIEIRSRMIAEGGLHQALDSLHPRVRWALSALTVAGDDSSVVARFDLNGRGLTLVPAVFADHPLYFFDLYDNRPGMLIYPVRHASDPGCPSPRLEPLLGRTRASVLRVLQAGSASTTELARRAGVSVASASEHAHVLRDAGLLSTDRGREAVHHLTPRGLALTAGLEQHGAVSGRQR